MGELDALEDDLAMETAGTGSVPAYLQVWGEQQPYPCVTAAHGVRGMHIMIRLAAAWRTRSDPCQALPSCCCRMWTCQQCRRGSRRRRRRSQQTSLGCRPSRSGRDREVRGAFATRLRPLLPLLAQTARRRPGVYASAAVFHVYQPPSHCCSPVYADFPPHCCLAATNQSSCPPPAVPGFTLSHCGSCLSVSQMTITSTVDSESAVHTRRGVKSSHMQTSAGLCADAPPGICISALYTGQGVVVPARRAVQPQCPCRSHEGKRVANTGPSCCPSSPQLACRPVPPAPAPLPLCCAGAMGVAGPALPGVPGLAGDGPAAILLGPAPLATDGRPNACWQVCSRIKLLTSILKLRRMGLACARITPCGVCKRKRRPRRWVRAGISLHSRRLHDGPGSRCWKGPRYPLCTCLRFELEVALRHIRPSIAPP